MDLHGHSWSGIFRITFSSGSKLFNFSLEFFNIVSGNSLNYSKKKQALISYCAGLFSALLVLPLWTLRLRISQISYCKGGNFLQGSKFTILVLRESILQEGFLKLYKGVFSTIIMSLHPMIQMTIYESAKRKYEEEYFRSSLSAQIGCLSRVTATSILYPFNLIKTKQQQIGKLNNQELRENMYTGERDYGRFNHALKSVYSQFGIGGFYRGLTPVVIRNGLQAAFFFYIYEHLNYLQRSKY